MAAPERTPIQPLVVPPRVCRRAVVSLVLGICIWPLAVVAGAAAMFMIRADAAAGARAREADRASASALESVGGAQWTYGDAQVVSASLAPDGERFAAALGDGRLVVEEVRSRARVLEARPLDEHGAIDAVAFSPDGGRIALATAERVRIVDAGAGRALLDVPLPRRASRAGGSLLWSPGGDRLAVPASATEPGHRIALVDLSGPSPTALEIGVGSGEEALTTTPLAFSPDGRRLIARGNRAWLVEAATGACAALEPPGERWSVEAACFVDGGARAALAVEQDGKVHFDTFLLEEQVRRTGVLEGVPGIDAIEPLPGRGAVAALSADGRLLEIDVPSLMTRVEPLLLVQRPRAIGGAALSRGAGMALYWTTGRAGRVVVSATPYGAPRAGPGAPGGPSWRALALGAAPPLVDLLAIALGISALAAIRAKGGALSGRGAAIAGICLAGLHLCLVSAVAMMVARTFTER